MKQISVFAENKPGSAAKILDLLAEEKINLRALSIADTSDYGIMRLIVDETERAETVLRANGIIIKCTEVLAVSVDDRPGGLSGLLDLMAGYSISVSYMYAFVAPSGSNATVVLKVDKPDMAAQCLREKGFCTEA